MKYFKNQETNQVYAYEEDGSQDEFISPELVLMTPEEVHAHLTPVKTIEQIRAEMPPLTRVQFKTVMLKNNLWSQATTLATSLGIEAQVKLEDSQSFERLNDMLNLMAGKLALSDTQVDDLFNEGYQY